MWWRRVARGGVALALGSAAATVPLVVAFDRLAALLPLGG
jgi:hypothetical protein